LKLLPPLARLADCCPAGRGVASSALKSALRSGVALVHASDMMAVVVVVARRAAGGGESPLGPGDADSSGARHRSTSGGV
jgi:hypothetical protein